jgi:general secretion pathway protein G
LRRDIPRKAGDRGLTLIELLITITILAIIASVVIPLSEMSVKRQQELELRRNLRMMRTAIDEYKRAWDEGKIKKTPDESGYPPTLDALVRGVTDVTSPEGRKLRFLRRIPRDPMNPDTTVSAEQSWGIRSYESDPDFPEEGDDVFDVYSMSEETAIDGTAYNTW